MYDISTFTGLKLINCWQVIGRVCQYRAPLNQPLQVVNRLQNKSGSVCRNQNWSMARTDNDSTLLVLVFCVQDSVQSSWSLTYFSCIAVSLSIYSAFIHVNLAPDEWFHLICLVVSFSRCKVSSLCQKAFCLSAMFVMENQTFYSCLWWYAKFYVLDPVKRRQRRCQRRTLRYSFAPKCY